MTPAATAGLSAHRYHHVYSLNNKFKRALTVNTMLNRNDKAKALTVTLCKHVINMNVNLKKIGVKMKTNRKTEISLIKRETYEC